MKTELNNDTVTVQMTKDQFINLTNAIESVYLAANSRHTETLEELNDQINLLEQDNSSAQLITRLNKVYRGFSSMALMLMDQDFIFSEFRESTIPLSNQLQLN